MSLRTVEDVQKFYAQRNKEVDQALVSHFRQDATYYQAETSRTAQGHTAIRLALNAWKSSFSPCRLTDVSVTTQPRVVSGVAGAAQCFQVDYVLVGRYVNAHPVFAGQSNAPPARQQRVRLPVSETIWVDARGQIIRLDNSVSLANF